MCLYIKNIYLIDYNMILYCKMIVKPKDYLWFLYENVFGQFVWVFDALYIFLSLKNLKNEKSCMFTFSIQYLKVLFTSNTHAAIYSSFFEREKFCFLRFLNRETRTTTYYKLKIVSNWSNVFHIGIILGFL